MSATSNLFSRGPPGWTIDVDPFPPASKPRAPPSARARSRGRRRRPARPTPASRASPSRAQRRVQQPFVEPVGCYQRQHGHAQASSPRPHRRSDRERQVGAGAGAGRGDRRRRSSTPTARNSIATCRSFQRGPRAAPSASAPSIAFTACATAPTPARRRIGRRWRRPRSTALHARGACRSWSAAPASTCAPCSTASPRCRRSIPPIRAAVRAASVADNHAALATLDPAAAARLNPADTTRIARALEVVRSTGRTLGRVAGRQRRRDRRTRRASPAAPAPAARLAGRALRPALRGDGRRRRASTRSRRCSRATSTRNCR